VQEEHIPSANTSAYSKARSRLPENAENSPKNQKS